VSLPRPPPRLLIAAALAFIAMLLFTPGKPTKLVVPQKSIAPSAPSVTIPRFVDRTLDAGLTSPHQQGDERLAGIDETLGPGACAFDYDADGLVDLFLVGGSGQTRYFGKPYWWQRGKGSMLFRNTDGRHFVDVTQEAGLAAEVWGMGCVTADLDNDGDADLFVTALGENSLYRNDGNGHFTDVTAQSGIAGTHWSTSAAVADFDRDGLPDIYVANYVTFQKGARTYEPNSRFAGDVMAPFQGNLYPPQPNLLFRNLGGMQFADVTDARNAANPEGRSLGVAWVDTNTDGWPDLLITNDRGVASNTLLMNRQGQRFTPSDTEAGVQSAAGHRGISFGDIDADGSIDLAIASERGTPPLMLLRQSPASHLWFIDRARESGIRDDVIGALSGWSPGLYDFNNDGRLDLFLANGLVTPDPDVGRVPQGQPKQLWLGSGERQFLDATEAAGEALLDTQSARGAAFADFDNDGDIDIYVAHNNDLGQLLTNESPPAHHWLGLQLVGHAGNRDAIGALVSVATAARRQTRQVTAGSGFLSDSDHRLHFGLGPDAIVESLEVRWPDGTAEEHTNVPVDAYLRIEQGGNVGDVPPARLGTSSPSEEASRSLRLAIGPGDAENRSAYLQILTRALGVDGALPALRTASHDPDRTVRATVINLLDQHRIPAGIELLTKALDDSDPAVAAHAVAVLCAYEDEASVRWMLRAFHASEPGIKTALSDCFGYYFREEEAVIHRKYLALPSLIRLLEDPAPEVRKAAARALGDAERYRAVAPLITMLTDSAPDVRAAAVRALGLIRDQRATPAIEGILGNDSETPVTRAQALIALKRLDEPRFPATLREFLRGAGRFASLASEDSLRAIQAVLEDRADGIVLNPNELNDLVIGWASGHLDALMRPTGEDLARIVVDTIGPSATSSPVSLLQTLAGHPSARLRARALERLLEVDPSHAARYVRTALTDRETQVRLEMLEALQRVRLPAPLPDQPLTAALASPETRPAALRAMRQTSGDATTRRIYRIAIDPSEPLPATRAALEALLERHPRPGLPPALHHHPDAEVRRLAFLCWLDGQPEYMRVDDVPEEFALALGDPDVTVRQTAARRLATRKDAWAKRAIERYLLDGGADSGVRKALLDLYPAASAPTPLPIPAGRPGALPPDLLTKILEANAGAADPLALTILKDANEPPRLRLIAARSLVARHGKTVVDVLERP
jgi:ASPIC and UnbV/HEAT repeats/FG-GAP-like repeat